MNENQNNLNPRKANPTPEQVNLKREIEATMSTYGYRYLDLELHQYADRLLGSMCNAIDSPDFEPSERLQLVYQIACNIKAVMDFFGAIESIKKNGSMEEEINKSKGN